MEEMEKFYKIVYSEKKHNNEENGLSMAIYLHDEVHLDHRKQIHYQGRKASECLTSI